MMKKITHERPLFIEHPPLKVFTLFSAMVLGVLTSHLGALVLFLLLGGMLLLWDRVPTGLLLSRLRLLALFFLFVFLFFPLYERDFAAGLEKAALFSGRLLFVLQMLTLLFHRLPLPRFLHALRSLSLSPILIQLIFFTLRFMEVFAREAGKMMTGIKSRGYQGKSWFSPKAYRTLSRLIGSLMLRAFSRSERIYLGLLSRGYEGRWEGEPFPKSSILEKTRAGLLLFVLLLLLLLDKSSFIVHSLRI